jgi:hypothetical protein
VLRGAWWLLRARRHHVQHMPSVHVLDAAWRDRGNKVAAGLCLTVESHPAETGSPNLRGDRGRARPAAAAAA